MTRLIAFVVLSLACLARGQGLGPVEQPMFGVAIDTSPLTIKNGILWYWRFEDVTDATNSINGPYPYMTNFVAGYTTNTGIQGNALYLPGSTGNRSGATNWNSFWTNSNWTVSFWVKYESFIASGNAIGVGNISTPNNWSWVVHIDGVPISGNFYEIQKDNLGGGTSEVFHLAGGVTNVWHFITVGWITNYLGSGNQRGWEIHNAGTRDICSSSDSFGLHASTGRFVVGCLDSDTSATGIKGIIDEVGVWSRTLTDDEVNYLYNAGSGHPLSDWYP